MKIAAVQMDVILGSVAGNVHTMVQRIRETRSSGALLTAFPECAATGYCFDSLEEARPLAEPVPGPISNRMSAACAELGGYVVFGMLESLGEKLFNVAVLAGPRGVVGIHRKVHLPLLGIDRFASFGDRPFAVHAVDDLRVGMQICYDASFPESARALMLEGADLVVLPTNWPPGSECMAEHAINTRALENGIYFMAVNRVGLERGFRFIGRSRICGPSGQTLAEAAAEGEQILYAEIDPATARNKHVIRVPGKHEIDRLADRRPEMYEILTRPHHEKRPGRSI
jgi:predicted amidohydrolase